MSPPNESRPGGRLPTSRGQARRGESYTDHETVMRQMADRIRWLDTQTHWWNRAVADDEPCCPLCRRQEWAEEWSA